MTKNIIDFFRMENSTNLGGQVGRTAFMAAPAAVAEPFSETLKMAPPHGAVAVSGAMW